MKPCIKCGLIKPLDKFPIQTKNGRPQGVCYVCKSRAQRQRDRSKPKPGKVPRRKPSVTDTETRKQMAHWQTCIELFYKPLNRSVTA